MTFIEAVKFLAQKAGITIREEKTDDRTREMFERLHYAHQVALEYFKETLYADKYREPILRYLRDKRNISDEMIEFFQLGLAGEEWDGFLKYAQKKDLFPAELLKAGLLSHSEKKDRYYDRFRQRLMIPIFNLSGKPIAFGGRALKKGENAKYINSPETPLYNKSNVLYGLNFTKQEIRETNEVIVVEGYFDLISLYQAGVKNVVASSGTAFTSQQARLLARFAETAYLFFDSDSAGQNAAEKSIHLLYNENIRIRIMEPTQGNDPDDIARQGGYKAISKLKTNSKGFLDYKFSKINYQDCDITDKEKLITELASIADKIANQTIKDLFLLEASEYIGSDKKMIKRLVSNDKGIDLPSAPVTMYENKKPYNKDMVFVNTLIDHPEEIALIRNKINPNDLKDNIAGEIYSIILQATDKRLMINRANLVQLTHNEEIISSLTMPRKTKTELVHGREELYGIIRSIKKDKITNQINKLRKELLIAEKNQDFSGAKEIGDELIYLYKQRDKLK